MTGGGWDWQIVDQLLSEKGQYVNRVTLTGLGERAHLATPSIGLETHISDVENAIVFENKHKVILVGHSYGGMVIGGVMYRIPDKIFHGIFLDAIVPQHGKSVVDLRHDLLKFRVSDGMIHPAWVSLDSLPPHDVPQPLKTFTDKVSFNDPKIMEIKATFVLFSNNPGERQKRMMNDHSWRRAEAMGWDMKHLISDHNAQRSNPEGLANLLLEIVD
tara:strand:+ start:40 stop:687 length:648 start_codon:yes stop_codon:yes gene_type:complete